MPRRLPLVVLVLVVLAQLISVPAATAITGGGPDYSHPYVAAIIRPSIGHPTCTGVWTDIGQQRRVLVTDAHCVSAVRGARLRVYFGRSWSSGATTMWGSSYRHPPTNLGWPSYYLEDYVSWSTGFAGVLNSLISEGVFVEFPRLKVVLLESGVTWLPAWMWRANKTWRGVRAEVPWVKRSPAEVIRENVRLTVQPIDAPRDSNVFDRIIEMIDSDNMLLFASDYPHWQFEGDAVLPPGLPPTLVQRIRVDNPLETYPRLKETLA